MSLSVIKCHNVALNYLKNAPQLFEVQRRYKKVQIKQIVLQNKH